MRDHSFLARYNLFRSIGYTDSQAFDAAVNESARLASIPRDECARVLRDILTTASDLNARGLDVF
jgi:hypothetical protein